MSTKSVQFRSYEAAAPGGSVMRHFFINLGPHDAFALFFSGAGMAIAVRLACASISKLTAFDDTAKFKPSPSPLKLLTPTMSPSLFINGPPEFPGLIGVCV